MNLIEAWKKSKPGQILRIYEHRWERRDMEIMELFNWGKVTGTLTDKEILSDDWEIEKEQKKMTLEWEE